jgi:hypothetical protein
VRNTSVKNKAILVILVFLVMLSFALGQNKRKAPLSAPAKITVMNPAVASKMAERFPLAPRSDTLVGKTIYMVNINWGGSETAQSVFEEMRDWFSQNMPGVKTVIRLKRGGYDADDPALWKEIAQNGNAAIIGVSG